MSFIAKEPMQRPSKPEYHNTGCGDTSRRQRTSRGIEHRKSFHQRGKEREFFLEPEMGDSVEEDYVEEDYDSHVSTRCQLEMLREEMETLRHRLAAAETEKNEAQQRRDKLLRENQRLASKIVPFDAKMRAMDAYKLSRAACGRLFGDMIRLIEVFHQMSALIGASDANFTIYGSAVRKLFEFISNPVCDQGEDFGSYPRDIDIKGKMTEQQFRFFHQLLKALVIKRLGLLEGMHLAIAEVTDITKLKNACRDTSTTRFTMVIHDKLAQKALPVDITLDDGTRTNDYNVNGLTLSKNGIRSNLGDQFSFLDIARSIIDRKGINLQDSSSFEDCMPSKQDISMMLRGLKLPDYTIVGRPIVSWQEDIVFKEDSSLCFEMIGCRCTGNRYLSFKTLAFMLQDRSREMVCPMCRERFSGVKCTPAPEGSDKMEVENLFQLADKDTADRYKTRSDSELKTYLSVTAKVSTSEDPEFVLDGQPVKVDGKVVKHSDIEDFVGLVRGGHEVSAPRISPPGWTEVFRSSGCTCSACTGRRGARSYEFY